jgi:MFS family permease
MNQSRKLIFGRYDYAAFLSFYAYASGSIVLPVALVALARELGFSLEEGGLSAGGALPLGRTGMIVLSMLLCGFAAGRWGKRRVFGWAIAMMGVGMGLCSFAPGYGFLFAALMAAGIGEGVIEGLATPFVQDLHPKEPGRYINFAHAFWPIGVMTTVLVFGALLSLGVSWRLMMGAVAGLAMIPAMILLSGTQHIYPEHPEPLHWSVVHGQAMSILKTPRFWGFFAAMFAAGGGEACLTFWIASYIQLSFTQAAWAGGVGTACFAAGMVAGRTGWAYWIQQHQLKPLIVYSALAGTAVTLSFPLLTHLWVFFGLLFAAGLATAPFWPSVQSYCTDCLPKADKTMLFILVSCAGVPGCGFIIWLMGDIGNQAGGLSRAFYLIPFCYILLAGIIMADGYVYSRVKQEFEEAND